MKKRWIPVLLVLALFLAGAGGYLLGRQPAPPDEETPPAQSDVVTTPVTDTESQQTTPFDEGLFTVYVKPKYLQDGRGVPAFDRYKVEVSLGLDGLKTEVFRTSPHVGVPYVVVGVGYGDADGYIQILDVESGKTGYTNGGWFTLEKPEEEPDNLEEEQKPVEQKPVEQKPVVQKPVEQKPPAQETGRQEEGGSGANPGGETAGSDPDFEYYTPETSDRLALPLEYQIHYDSASGKYFNGLGEEVHTKDGTEGAVYRGKLSG